jgi:regulator of protease activity HflC (stomatin/prohibitin superfamily)
MDALILLVVVLAIVVLFLVRAVRIVPQARAGVVERFGRYNRTLTPGLAIVMPFIDRVLPLIDLREQVITFAPQPVITEDNLVVNIDTVLYFTVTDPRSATYEIRDYIFASEQLTVTTLRNVVGGMDLESALTSRDTINATLRGVLDEATGKWGIRVNRVELKSIDPPASIQEAMAKQMRAERERRAAILTAEGEKQAAILIAEGGKQSAILNAEGEAQATVTRANAEASAIKTVVESIHAAHPDDAVLAWTYLQQLPAIANGQASKVWVLPSELTGAADAIKRAFGASGS